MKAADFEAQEAVEEGVIINWRRTIRKMDGDRIEVEVMTLDEEGRPQPTGETEVLADLRFEIPDVGRQTIECLSEGEGDLGIGIFDQFSDPRKDTAGAEGNKDAELPQEPTGGIDSCGACGQPSGPNAVASWPYSWNLRAP